MANPEHIEILKQGSDVWNEWVSTKGEDIDADLGGANLSEENLMGADLSGAYLV